MNVKKFFGPNSRETLRRVKEALGPDAVILSNRSVDGGVEIMASAQHEVKPFLAQPAEAAQQRPTRLKPQVLSVPSAPQAPELELAPTPAFDLEAAIQPAAAAAAEGLAKNVLSEIQDMRGMLEEQLAGFAWSESQRRDPDRAKLWRQLLAAGFSAALTRQLIANMPSGCDLEQRMNWIKAALARNLRVIANESDVIERGGVYALVGPTGVGKTTTTAKLAARCVVRHGADKVALLTTDGYRIGGHEQLRIYGKILGVMVHAVRDAADLKLALSELRKKHMVLIDTVGVGQRDQMVAEQVAMLCNGGSEVKRLLLLSATTNGDTLNEVLRAYYGNGLAGCIITKLDEAATLGNVLDCAIRNQLTMYYVANGQRVPEDMHLPNRQYLLHRAFKTVIGDSPYTLDEDEIGVCMAGLSAKNKAAFPLQLSEV